ncbi:hypothetical protein R1flu_021821 [Riccia fluitans]|uniref:NADP-dependent oxidoreductase domain-containing protein n=1 Tax=Riccia fluitans TaxID=41844 RepID=A0ABD1ZQH5_9MARC
METLWTLEIGSEKRVTVHQQKENLHKPSAALELFDEGRAFPLSYLSLRLEDGGVGAEGAWENRAEGELFGIRCFNSPLGNVFGTVKEEDAIASVYEAARLGINFFDTSPFCGDTVSETVLGKCLRTLPVSRDQYVVSTKCGRYGGGVFDFSADRVTASVDESLKRLQLDYIDIIQCHDIEFGSLDQVVSETIPALQKLKEAGKAKLALQYSLSNPDIATTLVGLCSVDQVRSIVEAAAAMSQGLDFQLLAYVEDMLRPVRNVTWTSGCNENN